MYILQLLALVYGTCAQTYIVATCLSHHTYLLVLHVPVLVMSQGVSSVSIPKRQVIRSYGQYGVVSIFTGTQQISAQRLERYAAI